VVDGGNPDRDLFVFRTDTNAEVAAVSGIGTLPTASRCRARAVSSSPRRTPQLRNGIVAPAASPGRQRRRKGEPERPREPAVHQRDRRDDLYHRRLWRRHHHGSGGREPTPNTAFATPYGWRSPATTPRWSDGDGIEPRVHRERRDDGDPLAHRPRVGRNGDFRPADAARRRARVQRRRRAADCLRAEQLREHRVRDRRSNPDAIAETTQFAVGKRPDAAAVRRGRIAFTAALRRATARSRAEAAILTANRPVDVADRRRVLPRGCVAARTSRARRCRFAASRTRCRCTGLETSAIPSVAQRRCRLGGAGAPTARSECRRRPRLLRRSGTRQLAWRDVQPDTVVCERPVRRAGMLTLQNATTWRSS